MLFSDNSPYCHTEFLNAVFFHVLIGSTSADYGPLVLPCSSRVHTNCQGYIFSGVKTMNSTICVHPHLFSLSEPYLPPCLFLYYFVPGKKRSLAHFLCSMSHLGPEETCSPVHSGRGMSQDSHVKQKQC